MMKEKTRRVSRRAAVSLLLCAVMALAAGCAPKTGTENPKSTYLPRYTVSPAPALTNEPAKVYGSVLTNKRVVSIILEGYSDDVSMRLLIEALKAYQVPGVFFISGVAANEHPDVVKEISESGFIIGNYGLNAPKKMQEKDVQTNLEQFSHGQEQLEMVTGKTPKLFRGNGSEYTRELLQTAALAGLEAGVLPSVYLNHHSFRKQDDALIYTQRLTPGAIISIKLGQELDAAEYERAYESMDNLAIDPPPHLSDDMEELIEVRYINVAQVFSWLLEALKEEGYTVLLPQALQAERITMFDSPAVLDELTLAALDETAYALPVTAAPLGVTEGPAQSASQLSGVVLVGDSILQGVEGYVAWRRQNDPGFLGDTRFLTTPSFGIRTALMRITDLSEHPKVDGEKMAIADALLKLQAKTVILMPGLSDIRQYSANALIDSIKLMIYQIREKNPGIRIFLQSIPPGTALKIGKPDNQKIFQYNLAVYKFCLSFGIPFIDGASALRDSDGNLPLSLCIDQNTYGYHLNDEGCQMMLDYLLRHWPT